MDQRSADATIPEQSRAQLARFAELVERWNPAVNLVSRSSLPGLWQRHILDSAQLVGLAPPGARHWVDLGSGGGFPGLVVAIVAGHTRPEMTVTLVESDRRKAAFLMEAARVTDVRVNVRAQRAEDVPPLQADVVSARALAALADLLPLVGRHLAPHGVALLPKGSGYRTECDQARHAGWAFSCVTTPSATDPDAVVLELRKIRHDRS